jgi:N-acetylmuramoyl-L-alanine amidase
MLVTRRKIMVLLTLGCLMLTTATCFAETLLFNKEFRDGDTVFRMQNSVLLYEIKKGDTLWEISRMFGISIEEIREANGLKGDLIVTGNTLKIPQKFYVIGTPDGNKVFVMAEHKGSKKSKTVSIASVIGQKARDEDRYWLAKIIEAEAGVESLEGKIAVGAVVINRVESEQFPDTIKEVIFQKYKGVYQFSPVGDGRIYDVEPSEEAYEAAERALAGEDPTDGALYFYNPKISKSKFFKNRELVVTIGNHQFFQ